MKLEEDLVKLDEKSLSLKSLVMQLLAEKQHAENEAKEHQLLTKSLQEQLSNMAANISALKVEIEHLTEERRVYINKIENIKRTIKVESTKLCKLKHRTCVLEQDHDCLLKDLARSLAKNN